MKSFVRLALLSLFAVLPLTAQTPYSITPSIGPTSGGTTVTIKGDFGFWPYGVIFGSDAVPAQRIDAHTLIAVTPAHLPGTVDVVIFESDFGINTGLTFQFTGGTPPDLERVLLPVFTPPVHGAFGSEFHTDLVIANHGDHSVTLYGIGNTCLILCPPSRDPQLDVAAGTTIGPADIDYIGRPGRIVYVKKDDLTSIAMSLRVHDVTRADLNFGTEIPIVRTSEFRKNRVVLVGVPSDPRFRNTLRIYGDIPFTALVSIGNTDPVRVRVEPSTSLFDVAYGVFGDFPPGSARVNVTIDYEVDFETVLPVEIHMWAMITVTNNETQVISTITPQP